MRQHFPAEIKYQPGTDYTGQLLTNQYKSMKKNTELSGDAKFPGMEKLFRIMKLTTFLILISVVCVFANKSYSQSKMLNLSMGKVTVKEVLSKIEDQSEFHFMYSGKVIDVNREVSINAKNSKIEDVLKSLFAGTDVDYVLKDRIIILTISESATQQQKSVSGKVTDSSGGLLPGVSVVVKGTTIGVITDTNGNYSFSNIPKSATLQFSFVGMKMQEIIIGSKSTINVTLAEETVGIEEVVAIGYGSRSKRNVISAISNIKSDDLGKIVSSNANMALQGRMAGVQVSENGGNPAAAPVVRIRGINTWGDSDPLYVIDGITISDPKQSGYYAPLNIMNLIDPSDIESVSVLKDASSAAIYGVRAANGVILITTKKGKKGEKIKAEFSSRMSIQNITQTNNLLNSGQYIQHIQDVWASDPTYTRSPLDVKYFDPTSPNYLGGSPTYNWQDAVKNKNAPTNDYSFRVSGGSEKSDYFLSLGSSSMEGTLIGSNFNRISANIKLNTHINNWITMGVDYRIISTQHRNEEAGENLWYLDQMSSIPPVQPIYGNGPNGFAPAIAGYQADGTFSSAKLYGEGTRKNMLGLVSMNEALNHLTRNIGVIYIEFEPVKHFKLKLQSSIDINDTKATKFVDYASNVFRYDGGDPRALGGGNSVGSYAENNDKRNTFINEFTANYTNSFGNHNINVLFSGMKQDYNSSSLNASSSYMSTTISYLRRIYGENQYTSAVSGFDRDKLAGLLGRISYNYKEKYYLDVTTRRDGSAHFAKDYRWGIFPSVSGAWRISSENFLTAINWINDLKVRVGWGQLGNQNTQSFGYLLPINNYASYAWGNNPEKPGLGYYANAATVNSVPNESLEWERTTTSNIGIDAIVLNNINFSLDYYNKLTSGILQQISLPNSAGIQDQPVANIASVRNSGLELSANYSVNIGALKLNFGANLTTVKNVVEKTYNHIPMGNIEEGKSMFFLQGYKLGGIFQTQAEVDAWKAKYTDVNYQTAKVGPGDAYFLDQRSAPTKPGTFYKDSLDNKIDSYDMVYLGKTIPGYYYGFNLNMNYKGIDLDAQFTGVGDVSRYNEVKARLENASSAFYNLSTNILNAWTPEQKSTTMPRVMAGDPSASYRTSNMFIESGAYLRLANIQIGYTLPVNFYHFIHNAVSDVRFYVGASNLFTLTKYTGYDPENDNYPTPQSFFAGLTVKF